MTAEEARATFRAMFVARHFEELEEAWIASGDGSTLDEYFEQRAGAELARLLDEAEYSPHLAYGRYVEVPL